MGECAVVRKGLAQKQKQHQDGTRRPRSPEDGRHPGMQSLALGKVPTTEAGHGEEYVVKLAMILLEHISNHGFCLVDNFLGGQTGSLLLEEISAPNPGEGDCRGIRYLCNLLDSVVTLAARKAKENGQKNILSEITGRDLGMQIGNLVPEAHNNQSHRLTATIFLNKDWQVDSDGGELRLSPSASTLATIPPVFDRVVFYPNHLVCPTILPATRDSLSARWSTRVEPFYSALSFICIVIFSCFAIAALVQRNDQFILGEAVISNIIYVLHHHIYNIT